MRWLVVAIGLVSGISRAQETVSEKCGEELPDAPIKVSAYRSDAHDKADDSMKYVIWNKQFTFAHMGELSSILYEVEVRPFCSHDGIRCPVQVHDAKNT